MGAAALGIAFVLLVEGATLVERDLRAVQLRDAVAWPIWAFAGLYVLLGAALLVFVLLSPRMPWMPTAAAGLRIYGMLATLPSVVLHALPVGERWMPSVYWGHSTISIVAGLLLATAVWSWWRFRRRSADS